MGRYSKYRRKSEQRPEANPIWRGIGCILIVVVPLISYALTVIFIPTILATGLVPYQLVGHVQFPEWVYRAPVLGNLAIFIGRIDNLWLKLIGFFVILLVMTGLFSLIYAAILQVVGPPRYSEVDAPPTKYKGKAYKR